MSQSTAKIIDYPLPENTAEKSKPECLSLSVERHLRAYFDAHEHELPASGLYDRILQEIERPLLSVVMMECRGNQLKAAELLGLNRNTLRKKMRSLGLPVGRIKLTRVNFDD